MGSKPRGYFFMINNVEFVNNIKNPRIGSHVDEKNLAELFKEFGYIVESHRDEGLEVNSPANNSHLIFLDCMFLCSFGIQVFII
jgi:hypothetical protein